MVGPMVADSVGRWAPREGELPASQALRSREGELQAWIRRNRATVERASLRDQVLLFALWMRSFRHFVFSVGDLLHCFRAAELDGPEEPAEFLDRLMREGAWVLGTGRRAEYMLNVNGIAHARALLNG